MTRMVLSRKIGQVLIPTEYEQDRVSLALFVNTEKGVRTIHVVTKMGNVGNSKYGYTNVLWCSTI